MARNLWLFSFVAGLAVLVGSFLTRDSHLERLRSVVQETAPGGDETAITTATAIVITHSRSCGCDGGSTLGRRAPAHT